ncbi:MAG TPA: hypothetical protein VK395_18705 [Gemmataceae bacterium]|nr:hypothetical protein [Gemmataceae bacterium]
MFVAYISLDEVNQDLATRTAEKYGVTLATFASRAEMASWPCDAVVYDLDCLPADDRRHILDELTGDPVKRVAAVHSYNLQPIQKRGLRRNSVIVRRRLHAGWLSRLICRRASKISVNNCAGASAA